MEVSMGAKPGGGPIGDMLFDIGSLGEIILAFAFGVAPSKSAFDLFSAASSCAVAASGGLSTAAGAGLRAAADPGVGAVAGAVAANGADAGAAAADP